MRGVQRIGCGIHVLAGNAGRSGRRPDAEKRDVPMKSRALAARIFSLSAPIALVIAGHHSWPAYEQTPLAPPGKDNRRPLEWLSPQRTIRVGISYDGEFDRHREGESTRLIEEAFALVNIEWQRYRSEWFEIASMELRPTGNELDASHVLGTFLLETFSAPSTIRVRIVGRQLEVYSDGRSAMPVGGLAFRGSDVAVVSAPANVPVELLAYYLFHEIGHLWEAYDVPFAGGETTYGDKSRYTFEVDAGNAEILDGSSGPAARDTPNLAPAIIAGRFAAARKLTTDPVLLRRLHDVLLHEAVPSNPAWVRKKNQLLADVRDERVRQFIRDQEVSPRERREETEVRRQLAANYWRAHEALAKGDTALAEVQLEALRTLQDVEANANVRILVGAVERKIRRRSR